MITCDYKSLISWRRRGGVALAAAALYLQIPDAQATAASAAAAASPAWVVGSFLVAALALGGGLQLRRRLLERTEEYARLSRELGEHQRQLSTLIGTLPGLVYRCRYDDAWTMDFVSEGCRELTGYEPAELLDRRGVTFGELIHPDDRTRVKQAVDEAVASRNTFQLLYRIRTKDGGEKHVWEQGCGVWDGSGALVALEGFITDVTATCRGEADRVRLDKHIRLLLESTGEGIYGVDSQGRCTFINHAGAVMLGFRPDELLGRDLHELFHQQWLGPDTAAAHDDCAVCERHRKGADMREELVFWHREGRPIHVECAFSVIRDQDAVGGAVVCFTDVSKRHAIEHRLMQLSQAVEQSSSAVVITDLAGSIEYVNCSFATLTGYDVGEILGKNYAELQASAVTPGQLAEIAQALATQGVWRGEVRNRRKDGSAYWARRVISTIRDGKGQVIRHVISEEDISATREAELALLKSQHRLAEAQRIAMLGNWELDLATGEIWWSDELHRIFGMPPAVRPNFERFSNALHPDDRGRVVAAVTATRDYGVPYNVEYRVVLPDGRMRTVHAVGEVVYDQHGRAVLMQGTAQDITERRNTEQRLHHLAYYDDLTGLPNRALFIDRLERAALDFKRHGRSVGLLYMDLDRFKQINETIGHDAGDALLKGVAQRLRGCVREIDSIGRMGGDNFAVLLSELNDGQEAGLVARKILDGLERPFTIAGQEFTVTGSIGISIYPGDGDDIKALLKNADAALDYAKDRGRNNYQFYSTHMTATTFERLVLENALRKALERDEFELHYQPQLNLAQGRVVGCEALLRWRHPELGLVSPMRFIPLAEDTGLIVPITAWVLRAACRQAQAWHAAGLPPMRMAVNISSRHFREPGLVEMVEQVLTDSGLPADLLELELTESVIMEHTDTAVDTIGRLWALGVQLAMDDFGTGYSSLSYLKRFPMQILKIDRSFINDLTSDPGDAALTRAIIVMAHSLDMQVVAEGVETAEQLEFLRKEGCDFMQGYYYSPPRPADEFEALLRSAHPLYRS